jgi:hypothetical protein
VFSPRSEVGWIVSEASRVVCPRVANALAGRQPSEGLERLGKIIRFQKGGEVFYELPVGVVVTSPDSGVFDSAVHSFHLAARPEADLQARCWSMGERGAAVWDKGTQVARALRVTLPAQPRRRGAASPPTSARLGF